MPAAAYTTVAALVARYGLVEMERLSTQEGQPYAGVVAARVEAEIAAAGDLIESYLRRRYALPLPAPVPPALEAACAAVVRYGLSFGSQVAPSEQTRLARKDAVAWLEALAEGRAVLDGAAPTGGGGGPASSGAMSSDRARDYDSRRPTPAEMGLDW